MMKLPWNKERDERRENMKRNVLHALATPKGQPTTMSDKDPMFPPPRIAAVQPSVAVQPPANGSEPVDLAKVPPRDILHHAAAIADRYDDDKQKWLKLADDAKLKIKDLMRENEFLKIEIAEMKNNMAVISSQREECRQRESDVTAVLSNIKTLIDHNEIPLALRARLRKERPGVDAEPKKEEGNKNGKKAADKKEADPK